MSAKGLYTRDEPVTVREREIERGRERCRERREGIERKRDRDRRRDRHKWSRTRAET